MATSLQLAPSHFGFKLGTDFPAAPKAGREDSGRARREWPGGREEAGSAGPKSLSQSAYKPPDNRPISGRKARGPERIILGKGAKAGDCCEGRCVARYWVRPPAPGACYLNLVKAAQPSRPARDRESQKQPQRGEAPGAAEDRSELCRVRDVRGEVAEDLTHLLHAPSPPLLIHWAPGLQLSTPDFVTGCGNPDFCLQAQPAAQEQGPKAGYLLPRLLSRGLRVLVSAVM